MYVSCSGLACVKSKYPTFEDAILRIRELGFGAFDLATLENWQHLNPSELADGGDGHRQEIADAIAATGLKASSLNSNLSAHLCDPDPAAFERYKREFASLLDLSERAGCPNITLQPGGVIDGHSEQVQLDALRAHAGELAKLREGSEVTVGIEGHANTVIEKPDVAVAFAREFWPGVGFTYDPSHFELQGIPLPESEALLDYTCHVHVRNASPGKMQDTMETGTLDFAWVVSALAAHGYEGGLAIEYFNDFDSEFESVLALKDLLVSLGVDERPPCGGAA